MPEVVEEGQTFRIEYDADIDAIVHNWEEYTYGEDFKDGCYRLLDALKEHDVRKMIVNTKGIKSHDEEDTEWLENEWIPDVIEQTSVEFSCNVVPDSAIAEMEMEELLNDVDGTDFTVMMSNEMDEARDWLADK